MAPSQPGLQCPCQRQEVLWHASPYPSQGCQCQWRSSRCSPLPDLCKRSDKLSDQPRHSLKLHWHATVCTHSHGLCYSSIHVTIHPSVMMRQSICPPGPSITWTTGIDERRDLRLHQGFIGAPVPVHDTTDHGRFAPSQIPDRRRRPRYTPLPLYLRALAPCAHVTVTSPQPR